MVGPKLLWLVFVNARSVLYWAILNIKMKFGSLPIKMRPKQAYFVENLSFVLNDIDRLPTKKSKKRL